MDEIKSLQDKYQSIDVAQLGEIISKRVKKVNQVIHDRDQKLKGKRCLFNDDFFLKIFIYSLILVYVFSFFFRFVLYFF